MDIHRLLRQGQLRPGEVTRGTLTWHSVRDGAARGSVGFHADMRHRHDAIVRLTFQVDGIAVDCNVALETQPMRFGGVRWWWTCPLSGRRAGKLHFAPGLKRFVHREVAGLAYQTWRDPPMQRGHNRNARLYGRLGVKYEGLATPIPPRPKGMHARVDAETCEAIFACEDGIDEAFCAGTEGFLRRAEALGAKRERRRGG